jgi:ribosome maturation factor RimP
LPHPLLPELSVLASRTASDQDFDVCDVQLLTHLVPMTLQVQIRRQDGGDVSLDECAAFSSPMSEAIETSAILSEAYVLEISSPGIGEQLESDRDFQSFRGFPVEVLTEDSQGSECRESGLLLERNEEHVQLNMRGRIKRISREKVINVRLISPTA